MANYQSIGTIPPLPVIEGVEFRHCQSWPGYCAGSDGSLWSCIHRYDRKKQPWRKLKPRRDRYGYLLVNVWHAQSGKLQRRRVHAIVCEAFHGPRPEGLDCCHNDGTRDNNVPSNLRWDTVSGNMADMLRLGTYNHNRNYQRGEKSHRAKLTNAQVAELRSLAGQLSARELSERFGISYCYTFDILANRCRRHG